MQAINTIIVWTASVAVWSLILGYFCLLMHDVLFLLVQNGPQRLILIKHIDKNTAQQENLGIHKFFKSAVYVCRWTRCWRCLVFDSWPVSWERYSDWSTCTQSFFTFLPGTDTEKDRNTQEIHEYQYQLSWRSTDRYLSDAAVCGLSSCVNASKTFFLCASWEWLQDTTIFEKSAFHVSDNTRDENDQSYRWLW